MQWKSRKKGSWGEREIERERKELDFLDKLDNIVKLDSAAEQETEPDSSEGEEFQEVFEIEDLPELEPYHSSSDKVVELDEEEKEIEEEMMDVRELQNFLYEDDNLIMFEKFDIIDEMENPGIDQEIWANNQVMDTTGEEEEFGGYREEQM